MSQYDDIIEWATTGGGVGDDADTPENVRSYVEDLIGDTGTLYSDPIDLPTDAEYRANGEFTSFSDLVRYLTDGGLVAGDGSGGYTLTGLVHILVYEDDYSDDTIYSVYIGYDD